MKLLTILLLHFFAIGLLLYSALSTRTTPEEQILGIWKEVNWEYEKVDLNTPNNKLITEEVRKEIAKNNILHESEIWEFLPNRTLKIHFKEKEDLIIDWKLKGRGNVLKLANNNNIEYYKISKLNAETIVLHLNIDIEARGIVKLTFKKS